MTLISLTGAGRDHGLRPLFSDFELHLQPRDRLGLIGPNGAGKSSLLRVLAGLDPLDRGERRCAAGLSVVLLDQQPQLPEDTTVLEAVFAGGGERMTLLRDYERLSLALAADPADAGLLDRLGALQRRMDGCDAWSLERRCHEVLERLGIGCDPRMLGRPVATLSGGNRRRVALAAALVAEPAVLLLDEPTNHLDAEGVEWLQGWLERFTGALVMVSHDRYLLDRVCRRIVAVEAGVARLYDGNYTTYLTRRAEEDEAANAGEARFRNSLRRELAWLRRGPKARSTKQKARLQRIEAMREAPRPQRRGQLSLASTAQRLGRLVINAEELAVAAPVAEVEADSQRLLLREFSYAFSPEDRVGIIGPNGVGKSSLLEVIAGRRPAAGGLLEIGDTVRLAYFDQHSEVLLADRGQRKVIEVVEEVASRVRVEGNEISASQLLERFLFPPAQQHQPVAKLSGGERRRLHLCRLLIGAPNVLLLDEPSNDLDVHTLAVLEDFLEDFRGCVVVVSHDRFFLDRCVDRLFCFREGRLERFEGNYSAFLDRRRGDAPAASEAVAGPGAEPRRQGSAASQGDGAGLSQRSARSAAGPRRRSYRENRELEAIERDLPAWEERRRQVETELCGLPGSGPGTLEALSHELAELVERITAAEERWLELSERPV